MEHTFQKVLILGAGYMGIQIAELISRHGIRTVLYDINQASLETANRKLNSPMVSYIHVLDCGIRDCDLIIETVTEDLKLKQRLLCELEVYTDETAIVTTNSSLLLPSNISKKLKRKENFCGYHFYWPDRGANIVDIMPTKRTEKSIPQKLIEFSKEVGLEPVLVRKEHYGYIYNDIFSDITGKAITLLLLKISTIEEIDKSFRVNTGCEKGPFEMMDEVGLDTVLHITRNMARRKPKAYFGISFLKRYVQAGKLGVKSGEGFYRYEP